MITISSVEAWKLLKEIEEYLFQNTQFCFLKGRIEGRVTTEKVVALLKELTEIELLSTVYYENKDTEIAGMEDLGKGIKVCATKLLAEWEATKP